MKTLRTNAFLHALFLGALGLTTAPVVMAGPALTGLAAQADNAESALSGSPAGMSRLEGTHSSAQIVIALPQGRFDVDEGKTEVDGGDPDNGQDPIVIPAFYYVRQLNDRWHAGASLSVPSGIGSDYGSEWSGRYESVDFTLVYVALEPALSYRINDQLSLGTSLAINYVSSTSETKIKQPLDDADNDGKITSDMDGIGVSLSLSMLYEFSEHTRVGLSWTSDAESDLEGNVRTRNLASESDILFTELGLKDINTEVTNTLPQSVLAGIYHEFDSGNYLTVDGIWMKLSDFSVTDIKLDGQKIGVNAPRIFKDIWMVSVGMGFPVDERTTYNVGAMYLTQPVSDDKRPLTMRIDSMWGVGAGLNYKLTEQRSVDLNANFIYLGEASVDTGSEPDTGRVVGKSNDPYVIAIELTYHL
jgi:long-chain fatty acid transport protein